jgi:hypothetical protein
MKTMGEGFTSGAEQSETLPAHLISPEIAEIFDALKAYIHAEQQGRTGDQLEAVIAISDGLRSYEDGLTSHDDVPQVVNQAAIDGLAIDWATHMMEAGTLDFDLGQATPLQPVRSKSFFRQPPKTSPSDAIASREKELLDKVELITALPRDQVISGEHELDNGAIVKALTHAKVSPVQRLSVFSGTVVKIELPLAPEYLEDDRLEEIINPAA